MADGIAITGATATGKTAVAIEVARRLHGEVISLDSRQIYQGMDIGTAKPTMSQRSTVPHFGIDILPPDGRFSAGRFSVAAREWVRQIRDRGHVPVFAGGTGFFLRALTHPLFPEPRLDAGRRNALKQYLDRFNREELLRWLRALDEMSAARMAVEGGRHRIARAIEVALLTGRRLSQWHTEHEPLEPPLDLLIVVLDLPRSVLNERIDRRVDDMLEAGLVEEVRGLMASGFDEHAPGMNATGYIELISYIRGATTLADAGQEIRRATRRYARRQQTWFRHQLPAGAIVLDAQQPVHVLADHILQKWNARDRGFSEDRN